MSFRDQIDLDKLPQHIAIIMDGNGRWATKNGKFRSLGHKQGVKSVRRIVEVAAELGIKYLTLYAFSTENWNRPKIEVNSLMKLLVESLNSEIKTLNKNKIRLLAIGDVKSLNKSVYDYLLKAIDQTASNDRMSLVLALSYSSQWEIVEACRILADRVKKNEILPEEINKETFISCLNTADIPDPELLIRTSGEYRISNFLLWQIAYSELYFTPVFWPDFTAEHFYEAICEYQKRERRFGLLSEQINKKKK